MGTTAKGVANGLATLGSDGIVPDAQLPASIGDFEQGAAVADQGALTASAPAALTSTAPAALTASAPAALTATTAAGANPTDDEYDALLADVTALRTTVAAIVVDLTALRTPLAAAIVDLPAVRTPLAATITDSGTARTKVNALLASLRAANLIDT